MSKGTSHWQKLLSAIPPVQLPKTADVKKLAFGHNGDKYDVYFLPEKLATLEDLQDYIVAFFIYNGWEVLPKSKLYFLELDQAKTGRKWTIIDDTNIAEAIQSGYIITGP